LDFVSIYEFNKQHVLHCTRSVTRHYCIKMAKAAAAASRGMPTVNGLPALQVQVARHATGFKHRTSPAFHTKLQ
jgi:hypothetical protein